MTTEQQAAIREAVARGMCKRRNTKQCAAICLSHSCLIPSGECPSVLSVWGEDADAAIAAHLKALEAAGYRVHRQHDWTYPRSGQTGIEYGICRRCNLLKPFLGDGGDCEVAP